MSDLKLDTTRRVRQWLTIVVDSDQPERGKTTQHVRMFIPRTLSEYPDSTDMWVWLTPDEADLLADMLKAEAGRTRFTMAREQANV